MVASSLSDAELMQPHRRTLPPPCFTVGTMHFSLYSLTFVTPHSFETISPKNIYLGLITPRVQSPSSLLLFQPGPGKF
ncbi:unnamed protein product [Staurois parvus]|uniref:Uncharacterized protein n=1 Tax=Staurois parvus TaxID=386267 RepID=A0ABN9E1C1_9NEOB|nr:unnamed protein product [Staurois parvus]